MTKTEAEALSKLWQSRGEQIDNILTTVDLTNKDEDEQLFYESLMHIKVQCMHNRLIYEKHILHMVKGNKP